MILHVIPFNDDHRHEETTMCACEPAVEFVNGNTMVTHNAFDGRECIERVLGLTNESVEEGKGWGTFIDPEIGDTDQTGA